jgi:hypothetical protein
MSENARLTAREQSTTILTHRFNPSPDVAASTLTISIVTYRPDLALLDRTLHTLAASMGAAREQGLLRVGNVALIDNSEERGIAEMVIKLAQENFRDSDFTMSYLHGHANIGYGAAHNPGHARRQHPFPSCAQPGRRARRRRLAAGAALFRR